MNRHSDFTATDHLDLTIKKGEALGILGKNGAGKSTLLKNDYRCCYSNIRRVKS